jgi:hypothetical protein
MYADPSSTIRENQPKGKLAVKYGPSISTVTAVAARDS